MVTKLDNKYSIDFDKPLPEYDTQTAKAFLVLNRDDKYNKTDYYGYVCDPKYPPRLNDINKLKDINIPNFQSCLAHFVVQQPIFPLSEAPILLFSKPKNYQLITKSHRDDFETIETTKITERFLVPLLECLKSLHELKIIHRAVQINNIFINRDDENSKVILGQCFTEPPGSRLSYIYELVNFAQADKYGRGYGDWRNDVFALGVSFLALLVGRSPLVSADKELVMHNRFEGTTYNIYLGKNSVPERWMHILRGMINEDKDLIVNIDQINDILYRQHTFSRGQTKRKNSNAIDYKGLEHRTLSSFSYFLYKNWHEARTLLVSARVQNWLNRSINVSGINNIISSIKRLDSKSAKPTKIEQELATSFIYLDNTAPIRLNNISCQPSALAIYGGIYYLDPEYTQNYEKIFKYNLFSIWNQVQSASDSPYSLLEVDNLQRSFSSAPNDSAKHAVLYEFYKDLPLKSKMFEGYYVHKLSAMLRAIEGILTQKQVNYKMPLLDADCYSYIKVQSKNEKLFLPWQNLRNLDVYEGLTEEIKILASLQNQVQLPNLENTCEFARKRLIYLAEQVKIKSHSKKLIKELSVVKHKGNLTVLLNIWDDGATLKKDIHQYGIAKQNYIKQLLLEYNIERDRLNKIKIAKIRGRSVAIGTSNTLSLVGLIIILILLI